MPGDIHLAFHSLNGMKSYFTSTAGCDDEDIGLELFPEGAPR